MNNFGKEINEILKNSGTLILEEDDFLPEWVVETKELIKKFEDYGYNDFEQGRNIVAQIMTICHYIDTANTSDSYKKLCQKIVGYTDDYKEELVGEAIEDDNNIEYRSPNSDEVDWDRVHDHFYDELYNSPLELFNSYSGTSPKEFIEDIAKFCEDYLTGSDEGVEQYSGEDTELDESADQDVELAQRIKTLYGYCTDLLNSGVLDNFDYSRQAERAFLNVYNEASRLIEFTDLYSFLDSTIMDMRQAYEEDSDNWEGEVIDDDATYIKCVNMSFDDLVDYSNSNNRREYVNNIKEVILDYFDYDDYNEEPDEYIGDDTELDESLILEDDEDEEGWEEEDSPIVDILKICNSISVEEDIHSLEQYADELYSAIYDASSSDPSEKYKKLYSKLEDIAENDFYQKLRESAWDDGDNSQYRDATPDDEEWDKAMDSFYEDWSEMPDYIISNDYNYDISDIIGDLRTLINDEFPDVQDIYDQDNQDMIDESLENETELEQVKSIIENKDNVNRSELKFIIRWCETCENSKIMRYIEEVRDYCMDSYITRTTYESVYDEDATSDFIYEIGTSDLIGRYATSSDIEEFADKVHDAIIDYLGFDPLNSDGSVRDKEYNGDDTELDEAFDPNNPYQMGLYSLRSQIIILNNMAESDHYSMQTRAYECYEKIKELNDKYGDKELIEKLSDIAFHYYFMLVTIGDDIFNNTKFDRDYLIRKASNETVKQFAKVLMTCLNEIDFNIEGIDINNYNGEDTELDESVFQVKHVTYDDAPNFIKEMMTPIAKVGDIFKSVKLPNDNYPFKNTNNDLNWEVVDVKIEETELVFYKFDAPKYTLECIDVEKKPIICNNSDLKNLFKKEENNKALYTGEDTEIDESVKKDDMIGKDYKHKGFGSLYYIDGVGQDYYHLKKARKNDSGQDDLFIQKDKLNKYFTKIDNNYDGSETELDESKKELSAIDLLIKTHKKYPEKDVTEIAQEIVKGNIEEYISLMKEYYRRFEK